MQDKSDGRHLILVMSLINKMLKYAGFLSTFILLLLLAGCSSMGHAHHHNYYSSSADGAPLNANMDVSQIPNAQPEVEPLCKYGNMSSYRVDGETYHVLKSCSGYDERGIASWYGTRFHGHRTSCGEPYNLYGMTAASKVLPLPTFVQVTNLKNGRQCIVKVNDRGPFHENRIIDLSFVAAKKLGIYPAGTGLVEVKAIDPSNPEAVLSTPTVLPSNPQIYLQIGAFAQRTNADNLAALIQSYTSAPIHIHAAVVNNVMLYRVQVGPLTNVDSSDALHHELIVAKLGEPMTVVQ
jgi:rare lipoprotein A